MTGDRDTSHDGAPVSRRVVLTGVAATVAAVALGACSTESTSSTATSTTATGEEAPYVPPVHGEGPWEAADAVDIGWSAGGLEAVAQLVEASKSSTLTVVVGGRLALERYFGGATADSVQDIASCQKSVTSTLVGMSVARGELELDQPVSDLLPAGWSRAGAAAEEAITIRHLLTMTSGLHPRRLTRVAEPGTTFDYNTSAYQKLRPVLETATGAGIDELSRERLFDPLGMSPLAVWEPRPDLPQFRDPTGAPEWGLKLPARDMARFGLLALRKGMWGADEVVSAAWFDEAWTSSPAQVDYGYLWWLMGRRGAQRRRVPEDWVAALGANDQKIYVIPSLDVVLTRQGAAANEASDARSSFDADLIAALLAARA
jgi:CubicO group peptidase (beta-lactamase class C family)